MKHPKTPEEWVESYPAWVADKTKDLKLTTGDLMKSYQVQYAKLMWDAAVAVGMSVNQQPKET